MQTLKDLLSLNLAVFTHITLITWIEIVEPIKTFFHVRVLRKDALAYRVSQIRPNPHLDTMINLYVIAKHIMMTVGLSPRTVSRLSSIFNQIAYLKSFTLDAFIARNYQLLIVAKTVGDVMDLCVVVGILTPANMGQLIRGRDEADFRAQTIDEYGTYLFDKMKSPTL